MCARVFLRFHACVIINIFSKVIELMAFRCQGVFTPVIGNWQGVMVPRRVVYTPQKAVFGSEAKIFSAGTIRNADAKYRRKRSEFQRTGGERIDKKPEIKLLKNLQPVATSLEKIVASDRTRLCDMVQFFCTREHLREIQRIAAQHFHSKRKSEHCPFGSAEVRDNINGICNH